MEKGTALALEGLEPSQHFTQPPAHYTEASLVKALEEQGIGRPSTYAPTITTIIARTLCGKGEQKSLCDGTGRGSQQDHEAQPSRALWILSFTANMESLLDKVADGYGILEDRGQQFLSGFG